MHSIDQETKHKLESTMGIVEGGNWDVPTNPQEYISYRQLPT